MIFEKLKIFNHKNNGKLLDDMGSSALELDKQRLKKSEPKKDKKSSGKKIPRTTIQTIPYLKMADNDITILDNGSYSKTFEFSDINYSIMKQTEQEDIILSYGKFLSYFNASVDIQINIHNSIINLNKMKNKILYEFDSNAIINELKEEYNQMLMEYISTRESQIVRNKYITLAIKRDTFEQALSEFKNLDEALVSNFKLLKSYIRTISNQEKTTILKDIFRGVEQVIPEFSENDYLKQVEKNFISPNYFSFKSNYIMFDKTYARSFILRNLPSFLSDKLIAQISEIDSAMNLAINIRPVHQAQALKMANRKLTEIESDKTKFTIRARKRGLPIEILPRDLELAWTETKEILSSMLTNNEKLFMTQVLVTLYASTYEELEQKTEILNNIASQNICSFNALNFQQEKAFNCTLPLGINKIKPLRPMTTNAASILIPFNIQSLNNMVNSIFYGINPRNNEMIHGNRKNLINSNGFILGTSGSGKSVSAKDEISQIIWKYPDDDIMIIDPQGEYVGTVEIHGGVNINFSLDSDNFINPLDISDTYYEGQRNPLATKIDFMLMAAELCAGEISSIDKSLIDRTMQLIYKKYFRTKNIKDMPTFVEFHDVLKDQKGQGIELATKLEIFCIGSQNIFSHQANVNINNRIISFNIRELNQTLKDLSMLILLDNISTRVYVNFKKGKNTWLFIDELHILLKYPRAAEFLENSFKTFRKWYAIPTGITQNIEDLLQSENGRKMLGNAEYVKILRQKREDRIQIAEILDIGENQIEYVNNSELGSGLLIWGGAMIPFKTKIPKDSKLLKLWGTSLENN